MSCVKHMEKFSEEELEKISDDLTIKLEQSKYAMGAPPKYIYPYKQDENNNLHLPFAYACREQKIPRPPRENFPESIVECIGKCRHSTKDPEKSQKPVLNEMLSFLSRKGSIMLSSYPGWGKTFTAILACTKLRFRCLVVVNKIVLMDQWKKAIEKFCPNAIVQKLTPKTKKKDADFYLMNAINVPKMDSSFFSDIGTVVIDEAHMIMAEKLSECMQVLHPRYLIGLTATPYRPDGLNILLELYFGKYKIVREFYREHIVYRIDTGFTPRVELTKNGRVNWNTILESQASHVPRNEMFIDIIKKHKDLVFLVLCKRKEQAKYLNDRLKEEGESVDIMIESKSEYNEDSRILIGTTSKLGVGFDRPNSNALLLAADIEEYFIQYLGRVFRKEEGIPVIFDPVDQNGILEKHFKTRNHAYQKHGGRLSKYVV